MITDYKIFEATQNDIPDDLLCIISLNHVIFTVGKRYPVLPQNRSPLSLSIRIKNDRGSVISIYNKPDQDDYVKFKTEVLSKNNITIPQNLKLYTTWKLGEYVIFTAETEEEYQKRLTQQKFDL